jgi:hypothetical protein
MTGRRPLGTELVEAEATLGDWLAKWDRTNGSEPAKIQADAQSGQAKPSLDAAVAPRSPARLWVVLPIAAIAGALLGLACIVLSSPWADGSNMPRLLAVPLLFGCAAALWRLSLRS